MRSTFHKRASLVRVAATPPLFAPWPNAAASAARFAATSRRLPTLFGTPMVAHELSARMPAPSRLRSLVSALRGRLAVVNRTRTAQLPAGLVTAVRALVRVGCNASALVANGEWDAVGLEPHGRGYTRVRRVVDSRDLYERRMARALLAALPPSTRQQLSSGVTWAALALDESTTPTVRLTPPRADETDSGSPTAVAVAEIDYRLVIVAGTGTAEDWPAVDVTAPAAPWPSPHRPQRTDADTPHTDQRRPWFIAPLLVPDAWLAAHADRETLAQWARLTGRSGAPDRYWYPETWDRFLEPGRRVGWLTANDVWRPRRGRLSSARASDDVADTYDPTPSMFTLTPDLERGVGVPPGYALVQCVGVLSVAVAISP